MLHARGGFDRLAGSDGSADAFDRAAAGAATLVETVVLGTIVVTLGSLGLGAILAAVMGRADA